MQINFNTQNRTNFGMSLKIHMQAHNFLRTRVHTNKEIEKLSQLAASQADNPVNVSISTLNNKLLTGTIWDGKYYYKSHTDSFLNDIFGSPVKFIEKCCKEADKVKEKFYDNPINKIFEKTNP